MSEFLVLKSISIPTNNRFISCTSEHRYSFVNGNRFSGRAECNNLQPFLALDPYQVK